MSAEFNGAAVYWVAAYLVDGLLIDTGCSHTAQELAAFLEGKGIEQAVNTHYHEDHTGANHVLMERFGVDIYAHQTSIPLIANRFGLFPYQEIAWGYPAPTTVKPVPGLIKTQAHSFQVIDTPGHCAGHICLLEPSRGWCFTGDLFARENPKFIRTEENIGEMIGSMQKLVDLPTDRLVLFTSVGKIVKEGRKSLRQCIGYFTDLAEQLKALERSGLRVEEIMQERFGSEHSFCQLTNGQFSTMNLVRSLLDTV